MARSMTSQRLSQPPLPARPRDPAIPDDLPHVGVSAEEVDRLVAEVMRHMLFKNYQQAGVPVRREELVQLITKTYKTRNLPNLVIMQAQKKFTTVFGFDMREIVRLRHSKNAKNLSSSQGAADVKCYVLKSTIPEELREHVDTKESSIAASFTLAVVSIISLCGEKVPDDTLWSHLGRLGLKQDATHHVFGDVKQCLESIIKQRYVSREKVSSPDGDSFVYELAEKSLDQAVKSRIDGFIAKMVKKDGPFPMTPAGF